MRKNTCFQKKSILLILLMSALSMTITGCVSLNKKYIAQQQYGLSVPAAKYTGHKTDKVLEIYYPEMSSQFSGSNFVYRTDALKYTSDYYNMFFVSPYEQINKNELKYLASSQIFKYTSNNSYPLQPDYILKTYVSELYADYRDANAPKAVMTIQFVLLDAKAPTSTIIFNKTFTKNIALTQKSSDALVFAWSNELESILRQVTYTIENKISSETTKHKPGLSH